MSQLVVENSLGARSMPQRSSCAAMQRLSARHELIARPITAGRAVISSRQSRLYLKPLMPTTRRFICHSVSRRIRPYTRRWLSCSNLWRSGKQTRRRPTSIGRAHRNASRRFRRQPCETLWKCPRLSRGARELGRQLRASCDAILVRLRLENAGVSLSPAKRSSRSSDVRRGFQDWIRSVNNIL